MKKNKAVFFDRDGILNIVVEDIKGMPHPPQYASETHIMPEIHDVLARTSKMGYLNLVVTNQPDVARGTQTKEEVEKINQYLYEELPIDDFFVCYHDDEDNCDCRKPKIGLFQQANAKYNIDFKKSWMVGDNPWRDIEAGKNAGCETIFYKGNSQISYIWDCYMVTTIPEILEVILDDRNLGRWGRDYYHWESQRKLANKRFYH